MRVGDTQTALIKLIDEETPVTTAPKIAERTGIGRRRVTEALWALEANDDAQTLKAGAQARVWWPVPHPWRSESVGGGDPVDEILSDWRPGRNHEERVARRNTGRSVLEYLKSADEPLQKRNFIDECYPDEAAGDVSADTFWRKQARPVLKVGVEHGHVRQAGREWRWVG